MAAGAAVLTPFALALKAYREREGRSQNWVRAKADLDWGYISKLESASRNPSRRTVGRIADALNLNERDRTRLHVSAGYLPMELVPVVMALVEV